MFAIINKGNDMFRNLLTGPTFVYYHPEEDLLATCFFNKLLSNYIFNVGTGPIETPLSPQKLGWTLVGEL